MNRFSQILLFFLLTSSFTVSAQKGHELDAAGLFNFLKKHPKSGDYILDRTKDRRDDSITRIHFLSNADFSSAQFDSRAYFYKAKFDTRAYFSFARFDPDAQFSSTSFDSEAYFYYTQFDSEAYFSFARFDSEAQFLGVKFESLAQFHVAQFGSVANFHMAQFDSLADFFFTQFDSRVDFSNAHFMEEANFSSTRLPDTLIFRETKITGVIDLSVASLDSASDVVQDRYCYIDLRGAPLDKFKLYYDKYRIYWPETIDRTVYEELTQVYEGLLKKFKNEGHLTSYATLDKEYQAFKDLQNPDASEIKKLLNKINFYWNNYGYNKERIWLWTAIFLAISTLINWLVFPYLVKDVYPVPMIDKALFDNKPENRAQFTGSVFLKGKVHLNFRYLIYAFYYTILIFFGLKLTTERVNFKMHGGIAIIFTEYLIGLICLGYLANFIISSGVIGK